MPGLRFLCLALALEFPFLRSARARRKRLAIPQAALSVEGGEGESEKNLAVIHTAEEKRRKHRVASGPWPSPSNLRSSVVAAKREETADLSKL